MIGKLRGTIDSVHEDHVLIDVGGVGYLVFASGRTLQELQHAKGVVALIIETHVREDHIHLYGFVSETERDWFKLLMTVQGVGAKMALNLLSAFDADQLFTIVGAQDTAALSRAHGVGRKLAERIANELKNKVPALPVPAVGKKKTAAGAKSKAPDIRQDAISALVNLGYGRSDAFAAVARAMQEGEDSLDAIIRHSLQELAA